MKPEEQYKKMNMDAESIVSKISNLLDNKIIDIKNFKYLNKNFSN